MDLLQHDHDVLAVAFRPDGKLLASATLDAQIMLWDPNEGELLVRLLMLSTGSTAWQWAGSVWSVFGPQSKLLASVMLDAQVVLWDPDEGELLARLRSTAFASGAMMQDTARAREGLLSMQAARKCDASRAVAGVTALCVAGSSKPAGLWQQVWPGLQGAAVQALCCAAGSG